MNKIKLLVIGIFVLAGVYFGYSSTQFVYSEAEMTLILLELKSIKAILCFGFAGIFFIGFDIAKKFELHNKP
jgi:hypothetical protein